MRTPVGTERFGGGPEILDRPDSEVLTYGDPEQLVHMTVNDAKGQPVRYIKRQEGKS